MPPNAAILRTANAPVIGMHTSSFVVYHSLVSLSVSHPRLRCLAPTNSAGSWPPHSCRHQQGLWVYHPHTMYGTPSTHSQPTRTAMAQFTCFAIPACAVLSVRRNHGPIGLQRTVTIGRCRLARNATRLHASMFRSTAHGMNLPADHHRVLVSSGDAAAAPSPFRQPSSAGPVKLLKPSTQAKRPASTPPLP